MKRFVTMTLWLALWVLPSFAMAEGEDTTTASTTTVEGDMAIFSDCTGVVEPNVLILLDTSSSMQGAYESVIQAYDPDVDYCHEYGACRGESPGDTETARTLKMQKLYVMGSQAGGWGPVVGVSYLKDIPSQVIKETIEEKGYFKGDLDFPEGDPKAQNKSYTTENYRNYMDWVATQIDEQIENGDFSDGISVSAYGDEALRDYNPETDYYRYANHRYGTDEAGYGRYKTDIAYNRNRDRVYVDLGGLQKYSSKDHTGGISVEGIACAEVKEALKTHGWSRHKVLEDATCECVSVDFAPVAVEKLLMTQNFLNYLEMKRSRRYQAINAIHNVIMRNKESVRFGIMQFDVAATYGSDDELSGYNSEGGDLALPCGGSLDDLRKVLFQRHDPKGGEEFGQPLYFGYDGVGAKDIQKETPLAEALVEAGVYFAGQQSWFNTSSGESDDFSGSSYASPIECPNQRNQVVIITDGHPEDDFYGSTSEVEFSTKEFFHFSDAGKIGTIIGDYDEDDDACLTDGDSTSSWGFNQTMLDDVAKFLSQTDLSSLAGRQSLSTTTISFRMDMGTEAEPKNNKTSAYLSHTAAFAKGASLVAKNQRELEDALVYSLKGVVRNATFSSALAPVKQDDLTYSGDYVYLTSFRVADGERGQGNFKKFKREGDTLQGQFVGSDDYVDLLDSQGKPKENIKGEWYVNLPEGADAQAPDDGAAGKLYLKMFNTDLGGLTSAKDKLDKLSNVRTIYSREKKDGHKGTFIVDSAFPSEKFGINDEEERCQFLVDYIYRYQASWPLGHVVHSNVIVADDPKSDDQYSNAPGDRYFFVGSNDAMMHCFDRVGNEVWAYIPPFYLPRLLELKNTSQHPWFIDGALALYYEITYFNEDGAVNGTGRDDAVHSQRNPQYLVFGERRGGIYYHLLLVDDMANPDHAYRYPGHKPLPGEEWGQSWGVPSFFQGPITKKQGSVTGTRRTGFVVGGGYDAENQDLANPQEDTKGRLIAYCRFGGFYSVFSTYGGKYAMPGKTATEGVPGVPIDACIVGARICDVDNDPDRVCSNIYAGDLRGNVYHFSDNFYLDKESNDRKIRDNSDLNEQFPSRRKIFNASPTTGSDQAEHYQKIFYAPLLGDSCDGRKIYFGTGDRAHPNATVNTDSIYAVDDIWGSQPYEREDLLGFDMVYSMTEGQFSHYRLGSNAIGTSMEDSKGWFIDFTRPGEKVISEPLILGDILVIGTYTPDEVNPTVDSSDLPAKCTPSCRKGQGRVYVISTCKESLSAKSIETSPEDPMPQPSVVFDKASGKALIVTGDGVLYDPDIPVMRSYYWKNSASNL